MYIYIYSSTWKHVWNTVNTSDFREMVGFGGVPYIKIYIYDILWHYVYNTYQPTRPKSLAPRWTTTSSNSTFGGVSRERCSEGDLAVNGCQLNHGTSDMPNESKLQLQWHVEIERTWCFILSLVEALALLGCDLVLWETSASHSRCGIWRHKGRKPKCFV